MEPAFRSSFINSRTTFWLSCSSTEPCWSNALPLRSWALPTTFRPLHHDLAAYGMGEAGAGVERRSSAPVGQGHRDAQHLQRIGQHLVDLEICRVQGTESGVWRRQQSTSAPAHAKRPCLRSGVARCRFRGRRSARRRTAGSRARAGRTTGSAEPIGTAAASSRPAARRAPAVRDRSPCWSSRAEATHRSRDAKSTRRPSTICFHRRAAANQVSVAVGAVDPAHGRPHLVLPHRASRVGRTLAGIGPVPGI